MNIVLKQQANSASSSASSAVVVGEAGYTCIYCGSPLENEVRDRLVLWLSTSTHLFSPSLELTPAAWLCCMTNRAELLWAARQCEALQ